MIYYLNIESSYFTQNLPLFIPLLSITQECAIHNKISLSYLISTIILEYGKRFKKV